MTTQRMHKVVDIAAEMNESVTPGEESREGVCCLASRGLDERTWKVKVDKFL